MKDKIKTYDTILVRKLFSNGGISLITLVITIVVIIILAMAVILSLNNNNVISNANKATVKNDISEAQNAYSIYIGDLIIEELDNVQGRGTIGKTTSDFVTTTGVGVEKIRDITLADIGIDSANVEEISILDNEVVGIKWKNKYYDVNGIIVTDESYRKLGVYKGLTITTDTEGVTYTDADGNVKELTEPVEDGDIVIYGDYEYRYNMVYSYYNDWLTLESSSSDFWVIHENGWGARVLDDTKNEYAELCGTILGKKVTNTTATFYGCKSLIKSPQIPNSVSNMLCAFYECESLVKVSEISSGLIDMDMAFCDCTSLSRAPEIPSGLIDMDMAFCDCTSLSRAPEIPSGVTNMGQTFQGCTALKEAPEIPNSVTDMLDTFLGCTALEKAPEIPSSVTSMGETFWGCTSLTGDIIINANPTSYSSCFYGTTQPIKLIKSGDATDTTLSNLASTANNGNVTY